MSPSTHEAETSAVQELLERELTGDAMKRYIALVMEKQLNFEREKEDLMEELVEQKAEFLALQKAYANEVTDRKSAEKETELYNDQVTFNIISVIILDDIGFCSLVVVFFHSVFIIPYHSFRLICSFKRRRRLPKLK